MASTFDTTFTKQTARCGAGAGRCALMGYAPTAFIADASTRRTSAGDINHTTHVLAARGAD